jgi:hypothetical protein
MKRYSAVFTLSHYSDLGKSFDTLQEARDYWGANNGGKHHNGGVWDNETPKGGYGWV